MSKDLEEKLIGSLINKTATLDDVAEISVLDFSDSDRAIIFDTLRNMMLENLDVDANALYDRLVQNGIEVFYHPKHFLQWANKPHNLFNTIKSFQQAGLHKALDSNLKNWQDALEQTNPTDASQVLERIAAKIQDLQSEYCGNLKLNFRFLSEVASKMEILYSDLKQGKAINVPTGFEQLDGHLLGGLSRGDLIVINGFTGRGKSALMLNISLNQGKQGICNGIVSREMSEEENFIRLHTKLTSELCGRMESGYSKGVVRSDIVRNMDDYTFQMLNQSLPVLKNLPIAIDTKTQDVFALKRQAKIMCEQFNMQSLSVDYLQLMKSHKRYDTESSKLEEISHELKSIAMDNHIPVIALSQYNEEAKKIEPSQRFEKQKGSSAIKQDASVIIEVDFDNTVPSHQLEADVVIRKNRNGQCHIPMKMRYYGASFEFAEVYG